MRDFDANSNGFISLSEVGGGILQVLCREYGAYGKTVYARFYRSYIRAFSDAKDACLARDARDDDFVTQREVRGARSEIGPLLLYSCC